MFAHAVETAAKNLVTLRFVAPRRADAVLPAARTIPLLSARPSYSLALPFVVEETVRDARLPTVPLEEPFGSNRSVTLELPMQSMDLPGDSSAPARLPPGSTVQEVLEGPCSGQLAPDEILCIRFPVKRRQQSQHLQERWWQEYDPPKANYISGHGRGPHKGHSINKADWPRQMIPIKYKEKWEKREKLRYAFRKNGYEYDTPKWGG